MLVVDRLSIAWTLDIKGKEWKGKEEYLCSAIYYACIVWKRSDMDHTLLPANTPCLPCLRKSSLDGAIPNWGSRHSVAAYYSSIDPEGMKGWVGQVGWPIADGLPTWVAVSYRLSAGQGKFAGQRLYYTVMSWRGWRRINFFRSNYFKFVESKRRI